MCCTLQVPELPKITLKNTGEQKIQQGRLTAVCIRGETGFTFVGGSLDVKNNEKIKNHSVSVGTGYTSILMLLIAHVHVIKTQQTDH